MVSTARFLKRGGNPTADDSWVKAVLLVTIIVASLFLSQALLFAERDFGKSLSYPASGASTPRQVLTGSSSNNSFPILRFRDDFNYNSTGSMISAGWKYCSNAPSSYAQVSGGLLQFENDGVTGGAFCWGNIPGLVHDWNITARTAWSNSSAGPNNEGTLSLAALTSSHFYWFQPDGFDNHYHEYTDGVPAGLGTGVYTPVRNLWRTLSMSMKNHTLSISFDRNIVLTFPAGSESTDLLQFQLQAGWQTDVNYDYVTANQILPPTPDFIIYPSPFSQTVPYGSNATVTISLYSINSFSQSVALSAQVSNSTGPVAFTLIPSVVMLPVNGSKTSTLSVLTTGVTATQVSMTVSASSGSITHRAIVSVTIVPPANGQNFAIIPAPPTTFVSKGSSVDVRLTIYSYGWYGVIGLSAQVSPVSYQPIPSVQFSPSRLYLTRNGTAEAIMTVGAASSVPAGTYSVVVTGNNYTAGSATVSVIVGAVVRHAGVTPGVRASYSLSISSFTNATLGIVETVTAVDGSNVTYRADLLVNGYVANSTFGWTDITTGFSSNGSPLPLSFIAGDLLVGDPVYLGGVFSALAFTSRTPSVLLGVQRVSISTQTSSPGRTLDATWDASTGVLYSIDASLLVNTTYEQVHYRLLETNAWAALTGGFVRSPLVGNAPLTVGFTSNTAGGYAPYKYSWNFGDRTTSTLANPTHVFRTPGTYTVTLTITDSAGQSLTSSSTVIVSGPPQGPNQSSTLQQILALSRYETVFAILGGTWIILAIVAVFLAMRPKRKLQS